MSRHLPACAISLLLAHGAVRGATPVTVPDPKAKVGWFNATELSVVITDGNSSKQTYGFDDTLRRVWDNARFRFKIDWVRFDSADDPYLLVQPGLTFLPGETLDDPPTTLVKPPVEPDVEKFLVDTEYGRDITKRVFWNVGASWDRNEDAGIKSRYVGFVSIGNLWSNLEDLFFATTYGVSYTDREETEPDPERDKTFPGVRLGSILRMTMGTVTSFDSTITANFNLDDFNDYTLDISNSVSVKMAKHLALKVSLQWQLNSEPALEDADVVAYVLVVDPDGVPGSGDEYFQTVASGGAKLELGENRIRKEELDTVFRTTLVIDF
jgi:hypothetical protein